MFPALTLGSKAAQTCIAIVRHIYIHCDMICRICNDLTKSTLFSIMILLFVILPYVSTILWCGQHSTILLTCIKNETEEQASLHESIFLNSTSKDQSVVVFLGSYYVTCLIAVVIDIFCYFRIIRYMTKSATQVAVISVTPAERRKGRNVITAPANLLICLINIVCLVPSTILQTKSLLLNRFINREENFGFEGFHYAVIFCISSVLPLFIIGSSADLRQDILHLRKRLFHKCNDANDAAEITNNVELALAPGGARAGVYAIAGSPTDYPS